MISAISADCMLRNFTSEFVYWIKQHKMQFDSDFHYEITYKKWLDNDIFIQHINARNLPYQLGHNQFSGMDKDEFFQYLKRGIRGFGFSLYQTRLRNKIAAKQTATHLRSVSQRAILDNLGVEYSLLNDSSMSWVERGGVTPVKDQGQCGSCWSFSTTGALEGAYYAKYGVLKGFSEQQLVDCDNLKNGGRDHSCNGGLMDNAFNWISKNGGLCSEADYPYTSGTAKSAGTCQTTCVVDKKSAVASFVDVEAKDDVAMMTAVNQQPVSIAIEADQREFQLYKSGVFTGECGADLDHGVLLVGYGTETMKKTPFDYYLVKNSWGETWGDGGYIKLGRGVNPETGAEYNGGAGQCGILMEGSYPVLITE